MEDRYTITDGVDRDTDLTFQQLLDLTDFTDEEMEKVALLKSGESISFPFFKTVDEETQLTITRMEEKPLFTNTGGEKPIGKPRYSKCEKCGEVFHPEDDEGINNHKC